MQKTIGLAILLSACATAPKHHQFQKTWTVPGTYDRAWAATVEVFAENNWPIDNLEKDSGIITTDWLNIGREEGLADCGTAGLASVQRREVKFNVFLRKSAEGPRLTVNTSFRELRVFDNRSFYQQCTSLGTLEARVHSLIVAKMR